MTLPKWAYEACELIDAGFFTGDAFHNFNAGEKIKWYIDRWTKELASIEQNALEDMPFWCRKCKKIVDEVNVHGYGFGDRMLEGVMYRVKNVDGKPVLLGIVDGKNIIDPKDDAYMHGLNNKHWNELCLEYCEDLDIAACPDCSDDVLVWGEE
jgi:hypothetical protein